MSKLDSARRPSGKSELSTLKCTAPPKSLGSSAGVSKCGTAPEDAASSESLASSTSDGQPDWLGETVFTSIAGFWDCDLDHLPLWDGFQMHTVLMSLHRRQSSSPRSTSQRIFDLEQERHALGAWFTTCRRFLGRVTISVSNKRSGGMIACDMMVPTVLMEEKANSVSQRRRLWERRWRSGTTRRHGKPRHRNTEQSEAVIGQPGEMQNGEPQSYRLKKNARPDGETGRPGQDPETPTITR